jgi:hypothetical protein
MRTRVYLLAVLSAPLTWAQFLPSLPLQEQSLAPDPRKPVVADIVMRLTVKTPWGDKVETSKGKYARSRSGNSRQDMPHQFSIIYESKKEQWIFLDHERHTALVEIGAPFLTVAMHHWDTFGKVSMNRNYPMAVGTAILHGRRVRGRTPETTLATQTEIAVMPKMVCGFGKTRNWACRLKCA